MSILGLDSEFYPSIPARIEKKVVFSGFTKTKYRSFMLGNSKI